MVTRAKHEPSNGHSPDLGAKSANAGEQHAQTEEENPFKPLLENLAEFLDYASYYLSVKLDRARLSVRRTVVRVVLALGVAIAAVVLVMLGVIFLVLGASRALAVAIGNPWAADLIVGAAAIAMVVGGAWIALWQISVWTRNHLIAKYERRREVHHVRYGSDIRQESARQSPL